MRKFVAVLAAIITFVSLTSFVVVAEFDETKPTVVQVSSAASQAGKTVEITVSIANNPGVSSLSFDILYDESKLALTNIAFNASLDGQTGSSETMKSPVTIQWINAFVNWHSDATFATLTFLILDEVINNTETEIKISYDKENIYNVKEETVIISAINGKVSIIPLAGDINGDGKVSNRDITRLMQYLANWNVSVNHEVLDVNGDGKVNNRDITRLMQYLANWDVDIFYQTGHTHSYGKWVSSGDSTHKRTCSCGKEETEAHTWDDGIITKKATHTEYGKKTYTCTVCHHTKVETVEKIPTHTYGEWVSNGDSTHKHTCSCGNEETEAHTWDDGIITKNATHTEYGEKTYTCTVCHHTKVETVEKIPTHTYGEWVSNGDSTHKHTCSCGKEETEAHTWDKGVVTKEATTIEEGTKQFTCSVCGGIKIEKIPITTLPSYTVTFYSGDDVLETQPVKQGASATLPVNPEKSGYRFSHWDKALTNITQNTDIHAVFVKTYVVEFVDYNYTVIKSQVVDEGHDAVIPANPVRKGYKFNGWEGSYQNINADTMVKATYVKVYTVTFVNAKNKTVKVYDEIEAGSSFSDLKNVPDVPPVDGYEIKGWNTFTDIHENLIISPIYSIKKCKVWFKMPDGTVIKHVDYEGKEHDYQEVDYGSFAIEPSKPEYFFVWEKYDTPVYRAYGFTNWSTSFSKVTADTVITAKYESDYKKPIIAVKYYNKNGKLAPSITLCNLSSYSLYGLNFMITYETGNNSTYVINVNEKEVKVNQAADWLRKDGNDLYNLDINNKSKKLHFAWSNGAGVTFNTFGDFITAIPLETSGGADSEITKYFKISEVDCDMVVSDDNGETFKKISPIIIYK